MAGQLGKHARVLAGDEIGGPQHVEGAQGYVAKIADRCGDNVQPGRERWFTPALCVASLAVARL
jgi:hypothetical protein